MNNTGRRIYKSIEDALTGAIEQMMSIETVGEAKSVADAQLGHELRCESAVKSNHNDRQLMSKLKRNIAPVKPLNPQELGDLILHGRTK